MKKPQPLFSKKEVSEFVCEYLVPALCVVGIFIGKRPVYYGCPIENHVLYIFTSGNILHFVVNMWSFFSLTKYMKKRFSTIIIPLIVIGVMSGFCATSAAVGLSGVLYAYWGMLSGGDYEGVRRYEFKEYLMVYATIAFSALIPHISWSVHFAGFSFGIIYQTILSYYERRRTRSREGWNRTA